MSRVTTAESSFLKNFPDKRNSAAVSRRTFVSSALATVGLALAPRAALAEDCPVPVISAAGIPKFAPDSGLAIRERKRVSQLLPAEITRLRLAYQKLRELSQNDPTDPRGWKMQALIHNCYCGDSAEIHKTYFFLPWHRAFLYYHERILGKLIGDMSFALPCWDWDDLLQNHLPTIYGPLPAGNSLFDSNRAVNSFLPTLFISPSALTEAAMRQRTPDAFLGSDWVPSRRATGLLESGPHNGMHNWTTDGAFPDMGLNSTAALDPVFYAHHANVDRMWTKWLCQGGGRANPSSALFLNEEWVFFDENKNKVRITTRDVLNHETSLRYRYDCALPAAAAAGVAAPTTVTTIPLDGGPHSLSPAPKTFSVTPDPIQFAALIGARPELGATVFLEIEGIDIPANAAPLVNVFWSKTDANSTTSESDPAFVGLISNFATPLDHAHVHPKFDMLMEVTDRANALTIGAPVSITLAPTTFTALPPPAVPITYDAVRLRVAKLA